LHHQYFYKNGKLEGKFKEWDENGQLKRDSFYLDDKLEGEYKEWDENGQLKKIVFIKVK